MKAVSQPHLPATISTGGAAKAVSVPPIETLTKSTPSVAYLSRSDSAAAKKRVAQDQRGERHRGRLGDEGAEQRHEGERREVDGQRARHRDSAAPRRARTALASSQDRAAAGDHHDREDEHRLGEVARVEVVRRRVAPGHQHHREDEHHGPEAEHDLHLAQQVPDAGVVGAPVRQALEELGRERVHQRDGEERRADGLDERRGRDHGRPSARRARGRARPARRAGRGACGATGSGPATSGEERRPRRRSWPWRPTGVRARPARSVP